MPDIFVSIIGLLLNNLLGFKADRSVDIRSSTKLSTALSSFRYRQVFYNFFHVQTFLYLNEH
jgi:hypothetical protein